MYWKALFSLALVLVLPHLHGSRLLVAESPRNSEDPATDSAHPATDDLGAKMMESFELVLKHHVAPPTLQQMVLQSLLAGHASSGRKPSATLATEVSNSAGESLRTLYQRELAKLDAKALTVSDLLPAEWSGLGITLTPRKEHLVNNQLSANRYVGIGIALRKTDAWPTMAKVFPGGPAAQAGATDGDVIAVVDGQSTEGLPLTEVIELLRGVKGSEVTLLVKRKAEEKTFHLTRNVVPLATVKPIVTSQSGRTVGLSLERVSASSVHELRKIADSLDVDVMTVVLDLRTSIGADNLHYGELLANALIDNGVIGFVENRAGKQRLVQSEPGTLFGERKLVAVVDQSTGGVLRWIASALQSTRQAEILGAPSAAAAMTSSDVELADGSLFITMPTHHLCGADGEMLSNHRLNRLQSSEAVFMRSMQRSRNTLHAQSSVRQRQPGVLYPDRPFPQPEPRIRSSGMMRRPTVVQSGRPLIELIERDLRLAQAAKSEEDAN